MWQHTTHTQKTLFFFSEEVVFSCKTRSLCQGATSSSSRDTDSSPHHWQPDPDNKQAIQPARTCHARPGHAMPGRAGHGLPCLREEENLNLANPGGVEKGRWAGDTLYRSESRCIWTNKTRHPWALCRHQHCMTNMNHFSPPPNPERHFSRTRASSATSQLKKYLH